MPTPAAVDAAQPAEIYRWKRMQKMKKTIMYRLFRVGAIPNKIRSVLENEGIILYDEGMGGSFIAKNVKGPGKRYLHRVEGFSGCLTWR